MILTSRVQSLSTRSPRFGLYWGQHLLFLAYSHGLVCANECCYYHYHGNHSSSHTACHYHYELQLCVLCISCVCVCVFTVTYAYANCAKKDMYITIKTCMHGNALFKGNILFSECCVCMFKFGLLLMQRIAYFYYH